VTQLKCRDLTWAEGRYRNETVPGSIAMLLATPARRNTDKEQVPQCTGECRRTLGPPPGERSLVDESRNPVLLVRL